MRASLQFVALHRGATRNNCVFSVGPPDFNPGVPRANAVTSSKMLAQMIERKKRSIGVNSRMCCPFLRRGDISGSARRLTPTPCLEPKFLRRVGRWTLGGHHGPSDTLFALREENGTDA